MVFCPASAFFLSESAETQNRTGDTAIFSRVLYQLSYLGQMFLCKASVILLGDRGIVKQSNARAAVKKTRGEKEQGRGEEGRSSEAARVYHPPGAAKAS